MVFLEKFVENSTGNKVFTSLIKVDVSFVFPKTPVDFSSQYDICDIFGLSILVIDFLFLLPERNR